MFVGYVFYTVLVEMPEHFQIVNGKTPLLAGIFLLPISGASAIGSLTVSPSICFTGTLQDMPRTDANI